MSACCSWRTNASESLWRNLFFKALSFSLLTYSFNRIIHVKVKSVDKGLYIQTNRMYSQRHIQSCGFARYTNCYIQNKKRKKSRKAGFGSFDLAMLNVFSSYVQQVGCQLEKKEESWIKLDEVMESGDWSSVQWICRLKVDQRFGVKERNVKALMVVGREESGIRMEQTNM